MRDLTAVADSNHEEARRVLADVVESIVLHPGPDGYDAEVTLKNETAAIAGGRLLERRSCWGVRWSKADLLRFAPTLV